VKKKKEKSRHALNGAERWWRLNRKEKKKKVAGSVATHKRLGGEEKKIAIGKESGVFFRREELQITKGGYRWGGGYISERFADQEGLSNLLVRSCPTSKVGGEKEIDAKPKKSLPPKKGPRNCLLCFARKLLDLKGKREGG